LSQESAGSRILKTLLGISGNPDQSEREKRREDLESSFDQDFYTVKDARHELEDRGLRYNLEVLRQKIRAGEVKVSRPSPRKTLIHKGELTRLLMQRRV
jgi:hypothetical protein